MSETVIREPGQGKLIWMLGGLYEIKVAAAETGGALTVMEITVPAGMGPPPHTHRGDELLYVLEGKVRCHQGDQTVDAGPGATFYIPAGTLEWFEPLDTARVLISYMPGGEDEFFLEAGEPAPRYELPPPMDAPPDFERLAAIGARYGLDLRPPQ